PVRKPAVARMIRVQQVSALCEPPLEPKRQRVSFRSPKEPTHLLFAVDDILETPSSNPFWIVLQKARIACLGPRFICLHIIKGIPFPRRRGPQKEPHTRTAVRATF